MRKEAITTLLLLLISVLCSSQKIKYSVNLVSGTIESMVIDGDVTGINWVEQEEER